jgi:hypothetical protein
MTEKDIPERLRHLCHLSVAFDAVLKIRALARIGSKRTAHRLRNGWIDPRRVERRVFLPLFHASASPSFADSR